VSLPVAALIAAAADTTRHVPEVMRELGASSPAGQGPSGPEVSARLLEGWHDFYILAGSAAATLVGLLFVALSFNLDILLHDRHAHLLAFARQTLMEFVFVLMISLVFLVPHVSVRPLGLLLALFSLVWLALAFVGRQRASRRAHKAHDENVPTRRRITGMIAMIIVAVTGLGMLFWRSPYAAYLMISAICTLLGNAAGGSWHLLVEVGKLKSGEKKSAGQG
jgi:hypothetical protein